MKNNFTKHLVLAALFVALGMLLPFLTGQIPQIGSMMLPMHIPVLPQTEQTEAPAQDLFLRCPAGGL